MNHDGPREGPLLNRRVSPCSIRCDVSAASSALTIDRGVRRIVRVGGDAQATRCRRFRPKFRFWNSAACSGDWWVSDESILSKADRDGGIRIEIHKDTSNPWDAILGQNDISVVPDQTYTLQFKLSTSEGNSQRFNVTWVLQDPQSHKKYFSKEFEIPATGSKLKIVDLSVPESNKNASLQLWLGGPSGVQKAKDKAVDLKDFSFSESSTS